MPQGMLALHATLVLDVPVAAVCVAPAPCSLHCTSTYGQIHCTEYCCVRSTSAGGRAQRTSACSLSLHGEPAIVNEYISPASVVYAVPPTLVGYTTPAPAVHTAPALVIACVLWVGTFTPAGPLRQWATWSPRQSS